MAAIESITPSPLSARDPRAIRAAEPAQPFPSAALQLRPVPQALRGRTERGEGRREPRGAAAPRIAPQRSPSRPAGLRACSSGPPYAAFPSALPGPREPCGSGAPGAANRRHSPRGTHGEVVALSSVLLPERTRRNSEGRIAVPLPPGRSPRDGIYRGPHGPRSLRGAEQNRRRRKRINRGETNLSETKYIVPTTNAMR